MRQSVRRLALALRRGARRAARRLPADFDETTYLVLHSDVRAAVASGAFLSGLDHYLRIGQSEGRGLTPSADVEPPTVSNLAGIEVEPGTTLVLGETPQGAVRPVTMAAISGSGRAVSPPVSLRAVFGGQPIATPAPEDTSQNEIEKFSGLIRCGRSAPAQLRFWAEPAGAPLDAEPSMIAGDAGEKISALAEFLKPTHLVAYETMAHAIGPALSTLWRDMRAPEAAVDRHAFGTQTADPEVSIVIPVFGRSDLTAQQIESFSGDDDLKMAEIIFVIDDPSLKDDLLGEMPRLAAAHGLSFQALFLSRNTGFATACNIGVRYSTAPWLLLLNNDVLPIGPGWLRHAMKRAANIDRLGILGACLLYPDGTVQHAGLQFFHTEECPGYALARHPFQRQRPDDHLPRDPYPLPSVTGAFMLMKRKLFHDVGGFDEGFIVADYEDPDLCFRIEEMGFRHWVDPALRLIHLERQSIPLRSETDSLSVLRSMHNCWMMTSRWQDRLESLTKPSPSWPIGY